MIFPAAGLDGLTSLDVQQPGPLVDQLLKMPQGQPFPGPAVNENMPLFPVPHIMPQHLAGITGQLHGLRHVAPGPAVVLALGLGEGDLAGVAVPQFDPGLQDLPGPGGGLVDHPEKGLFPQGDLGGGELFLDLVGLR